MKPRVSYFWYEGDVKTKIRSVLPACKLVLVSNNVKRCRMLSEFWRRYVDTTAKRIFVKDVRFTENFNV